MRKLILPLILIIVAIVWGTAIVHAESKPEAAATITPTTTTYEPASWRSVDTKGLPECESEDGTGMALCEWDAATMGNGKGTSLISGDCAPSIVGGWLTASRCVLLYSKPGGKDAAMECMGAYNENSDEALIEMGWTFDECYKAMGLIDELYN